MRPEILEIGPSISCILANFLLRMHRNGQNSTFGQSFDPIFEISMGCLYSNTNFGGASAKIYTCFERNTACVMQNLGAIGGLGKLF